MLAYFGLLEGLAAEHDDQSRPFDWTGFLLLSLALGLFQLMMDRGQTLDWFESTEIVAEGFFAAVLCFMFFVHSRRPGTHSSTRACSRTATSSSRWC